MTLMELRQGILRFTGKGHITVLGDFNARVGNLPNVVYTPGAQQDSPVTVMRESEDIEVNTRGRRVLTSLNQVGMVLLNGVLERAKGTSLQRLANTVIDFIWVQFGNLGDVLQFQTVEDDCCRWSDHRMVTVSMKVSVGNSLTTDTPSQSGTLPGEQLRWNLKGKNSWCNLQEAGNRLMLIWAPKLEGKHTEQKEEAEELWSQWLSEMRRTAELGLGYAPPIRPRRKDHDPKLAKLVQERNAIRKRRDRATAEERALAQSELREAQKKVRVRAAQKKVRVRAAATRTLAAQRRDNVMLKCNSRNPSIYWDLLKKTVGLQRKKVALPGEVIFKGVVASGDAILEVWREAFQKLSAVDREEKSFRVQFLEEIQQEVRAESAISQQFDYLNTELNQPIECEEVLGIIAKLNLGKAAGLDAMVNELFKYGGEVWLPLDYAMSCFVLKGFLKTGRAVSYFLSTRMAMQECQIITVV